MASVIWVGPRLCISVGLPIHLCNRQASNFSNHDTSCVDSEFNSKSKCMHVYTIIHLV